MLLTTSFSGLPLVVCGVLKIVLRRGTACFIPRCEATGGAGPIKFSSIGSSAHGFVNLSLQISILF
jgi:hypothetical protein